MDLIDSNFMCVEIKDKAVKEKEKAKLDAIKTLFHYSDQNSINKIKSQRKIRFTRFEKQKTEKSFEPTCKATYYIACFSTAELSKQEIRNKHFKGKKTIDAALEFNFDSVFNLFDERKCCILVSKDNQRYNIKFKGKNSVADDTANNKYIDKIFLEINPQIVEYTNNEKNESFFELDGNRKIDIKSNIGKKVLNKFEYQHEVKMVASLMAASAVEVDEFIRLEVYFNPSANVTLKNIN